MVTGTMEAKAIIRSVDVQRLVRFYDNVVNAYTNNSEISELESIRVEYSTDIVEEEWGDNPYRWDLLDQYSNQINNKNIFDNVGIDVITASLMELICRMKDYQQNQDKEDSQENQKQINQLKKELIKKIDEYLRHEKEEREIDDYFEPRIKKPSDPRDELSKVLKKVRKELEKTITNEDEGQRITDWRKMIVLGRFVSENINKPFSMSETKIVLYINSIDKVAVSQRISFYQLLRIVFVHELFHAYHTYHYSKKHLNSYPYVKYKDKVISESLAAYVEYLYSRKQHEEGVRWGTKRIEEWRESDASWFPYSGALVLKHNMIDDEDSWASKVFHDSIDGMDEKTRTKVGKIIIDAYHLEKELYKF